MAVTLKQAADLRSMPIVETRAMPPGYSAVHRGTLYLHPLDVLLLARPELTPAQRVMVLVDRIYERAIATLDEHMEQTCTCTMTDPKYWFTYYGAVEPGSQWEQNPDCPLHGYHEEEGARA